MNCEEPVKLCDMLWKPQEKKSVTAGRSGDQQLEAEG
jgi:hypothetical protein